jgi:hypothetical protein
VLTGDSVTLSPASRVIPGRLITIYEFRPNNKTNNNQIIEIIGGGDLRSPHFIFEDVDYV